MFYHSNGKLTVMAAPRCGHTTMYHYFNIEPYSLSYEDLPVDNLVVVVRNPIDRMVSAIKGLSPHLAINAFNRSSVDDPADIMADDERFIFNTHCKPYLYPIIDTHKNLRVIDFYKLDHYIPKLITSQYSHIVRQSPVTDTRGLTNPKEHYVENSIFSLLDLEQEYDLYQNIMRVKEQISVEEWKSLTP